jgi:hypothetical protein
VGHNEDPIAEVRGTNGRRRYAVPFTVIPARGQVAENSSHAPSKQSWDVLHDDVAGSYVANQSAQLRPEPAAGPVDPCVLPGVADVLAGEPPADEVNGFELSSVNIPHVPVSPHIGPMLFQHT